MRKVLALLVFATAILVGAQPAAASYATTVTNFDAAGNQVTRFDTAGNAVDAHDGDLLAAGGSYYLYGTSYDCGFGWQQGGTPFCGFKVYSSTDLVHWTDRGALFDATTSTWQSRCNGNTFGCYRPHVVYNAATARYVLWINTYDIGVGYHVFTSTTPTGPFTEQAIPTLAVNNGIPPGVNNGDHDVFVDDDGTGYLAYTDWRTGGDIVVERLNSAYTSGTGTYARLGQSATEAPALFRRGSGYYLAYSDPNCGYCTTGTSVKRASSPLGPWSAGTKLTTDSCGGQPSFVADIEGTYVYGSDLWSNGAPNEALANFFWAPLGFAGDGSVNAIACSATASLTLTGGAAGTQVHPADLDQDGGVSGYRTYCDVGGNVQRSQSFVASRTGTLSAVSYTTFQRGYPNAGLRIAVHTADSAYRPTGGALFSTVVPASAVGWSPRNITVHPGLSVSAGTRYAIVVSSSTTTGCYGLQYHDGAPYPGGGEAYSSNNGASFGAESNRTVKFQTSIGTTNPALTATATASSSFEGCCGWRLTALTDGQDASTPTSMGWSSTNSLNVNHTEWVSVDLGGVKAISRVTLLPRGDAGNAGEGFPADFTVQSSVDGVTWTVLAARTGYPKPAAVAQHFDFGTQAARYVRVVGTGLRNTNPNDPLYRMQLAELKVA
ncbi:family 43 glycosylhydrolase [Dactylosporangium siamense]|uniref:F5/8 type C domain-containing protein n=1 Tax=Dactylosporangium siamense TaxID=685454 RepID=A0A919PGC0_9ACTN|nr:family 43 glycosylhydrolase [Dactylosporangium siamense]GIG43424.1 hypothetical protein Dsi01nite_014650 [Dactylosporangium siamense]